jgi:hypothetical protein
MTSKPVLADTRTPGPCIWVPCVATWEHYHGGFPGGYTNPYDPDGVPIIFRGPNPDPTAVRDYNGAALGHRLAGVTEGEPR